MSLFEIEALLAASERVRFAGCGRAEIYIWMPALERLGEVALLAKGDVYGGDCKSQGNGLGENLAPGSRQARRRPI